MLSPPRPSGCQAGPVSESRGRRSQLTVERIVCCGKYAADGSVNGVRAAAEREAEITAPLHLASGKGRAGNGWHAVPGQEVTAEHLLPD